MNKEEVVFEALANLGEIPNLEQMSGKVYKSTIDSVVDSGAVEKREHYSITSFPSSNALYVEDYCVGGYKIFRLVGADSKHFDHYSKYFYVHNEITVKHN